MKAALIVAVTAAAVAATMRGPAQAPQPALPGAALRAADRLGESAPRFVRLTSPTLTLQMARGYARRRIGAVPLPPGGRFTGIRWERAPQPLTPGTVELTLRFNAQCQWMRAAAEHQPDAAAVLAATRRWPGLRGVAGVSLASCYASRNREVQYAKKHRLRATS